MLRRIAEDMYWLGRYTERVENHARLLDVGFHTYQEWSADNSKLGELWYKLLHVLGAAEREKQLRDGFTKSDILFFMAFDVDNGNSILSCMAKARDNLRSVRERVPAGMWDSLNEAYLWLKDSRMEEMEKSPYAFCQEIKQRIAVLYGIADSTMLRQGEWHWLNIGRHIERADNTVRLLKLAYLRNQGNYPTGIPQYHGYTATLRSLDGMEAFRRLYADHMTFEYICQFLIVTAFFPRSILFALNATIENIAALQSEETGKTLLAIDKISRRVCKIRANLACLDSNVFSPNSVESLLGELLDSCNQVAGDISRTLSGDIPQAMAGGVECQ